MRHLAAALFGLALAAPSAAYAETPVIDVLVVLDGGAVAWANDGRGGMAQYAEDVMAAASQIYENSALDVVFNVVHVAELPVTFGSNASTALSDLRVSDNAWAVQARNLRETHHADLVVMLIDTGDTGQTSGFCGQAYLFTRLPNPNSGYGVNLTRCIDVGFVLPHEIGHNLGAHHSKFQAAQPGPNLGLFPFSAGWYFAGSNNTRYATVMAYANSGVWDSTVSVGATEYENRPLLGSPLTSASGPLVDCGLGTSTCTAASGGKVCLISRGDVSFADKVLNCQNGGGSAAIIYNNTDGMIQGTLGGAPVTIPTVALLQVDGQVLVANHLGATATVTVNDDGFYTRTPRFSSPDQEHEGGVPGDAEHGDNVRTLRGTIPYVAQYRKVGHHPVTVFSELGGFHPQGFYDGEGIVTDNLALLDCPTRNDAGVAQCFAQVLSGTTLTLTASPKPGTVFISWFGDCAHAGTNPVCVLEMTQPRTSVLAGFTKLQTLTVDRVGTGTGTVTSNFGGINCGSTCSAEFQKNDAPTLTATPAEGSSFAGWSGGACSGTSPTCHVLMEESQTVTATFTANAAGPPGPVTGLSARAGDGQVTLTWSMPTDGGSPIIDYIVQFSTDGGSSWTTSDDGVSTETTAIVTGLDNGATYWFRVIAVNAVGQGPTLGGTDIVSRTVGICSLELCPGGQGGWRYAAMIQVGATISELTASLDVSGAVQLSWTAPSARTTVNSYRVQYSFDGGQTWFDYDVGLSTATSALLEGLVPGTYLFRVAAVFSGGLGPYTYTGEPLVLDACDFRLCDPSRGWRWGVPES